jgi:Putative metallopeptidase family (DUF6782)
MPGNTAKFEPKSPAPIAKASPGPRSWLFQARLPVLAGIAALAWSGLSLTFMGKPGEGATAGYRPGGQTPAHASHPLSARTWEADACVPLAEAATPGTAVAPEGSIARLLETLARSATARTVLKAARARRVRVCLDEKTDLLAYYFSSMGVIGLSTELSQGGRIAFLAHELSHVPQHPRYSDNRYFPPEDLLLLRRVREATAEAIATRIAWELREAGYPAAWNEKGASPYADVVRAFRYAADGNAGAEGLQAATRAAFDYWFTAGWRRDVYDRMTVEHLQRISRDRTGMVPPRRKLRANFLIGIATLGGGNFIAETHGPALTDSFYAGRVSSRIARRIEGLLRDANLAVLPAGEALLFEGSS